MKYMMLWLGTLLFFVGLYILYAETGWNGLAPALLLIFLALVFLRMRAVRRTEIAVRKSVEEARAYFNRPA